MRKLTIPILPACCSSPPPSAAAASQLQPYTSVDGRFSVMFPVERFNNRRGRTLWEVVSLSLVELDNNEGTYLVSYFDYSPNYITGGAQKFLAQMRDQGGQDKTLTSDAAIDLNGVPGRAFTITDKDGSQYTIHVFLNGQCEYELIVLSHSGYSALYTDEFMNSFRIQ